MYTLHGNPNEKLNWAQTKLNVSYKAYCKAYCYT